MTFDELIQLNGSIYATCYNRDCGHAGDLDLVKLGERFGLHEPMPIGDSFRRHLVCSQCGRKEMGIVIIPYGHPKSPMVAGSQ